MSLSFKSVAMLVCLCVLAATLPAQTTPLTRSDNEIDRVRTLAEARRRTLTRRNLFAPARESVASATHIRWIRGIALSPDGRRVVSWSQDGSMLLWRSKDAQVLAQLGLRSGTGVNASFSPDGTRLLVHDAHARTAELRDGSNGRWIARLGGETSLILSAVYCDDSRIMTARDSGVVRFHDGATGAALPEPVVQTVAFRRAVASKDGGHVATCGFDGTVRLWNGTTGAPLASMADLGYGSTLIRGQRVVGYPSHVDRHYLGAYDFETESTISIEQAAGEFNGTRTGPHGKRVVSLATNGAVRLWNLETGERVAELHPPGSKVTNAVFSQTGDRVVTLGRKTTLWDATKGAQVATLGSLRASPTAACFAPDGSWLMTAGFGGGSMELRLWNGRTGESRGSVSALLGGNPIIVSSNDGRIAAVGDYMGRVVIIDTATASVTAVRPRSPEQRRSMAMGRAGQLALVDNHVLRSQADWSFVPGSALPGLDGVISPDGARAGMRSYFSVVIVDLNSREVEAKLQGFGTNVTRINWSPDGERLLTSDNAGQVRLWEASSGRTLGDFPSTLSQNDHSVHVADFAPDGKSFAVAGADGGVTLRNAGGKTLWTAKGHDGAVSHVRFSPRGTLASVGLDSEIQLWDVTKGEVLRTLSGHEGRVRYIEFSPRGDLLCSVGEYGTAILWRVVDGQVAQRYVGHDEDVTFVAFDEDGDEVLTAGFDGSARVWSIDDGHCRAVLEGHFGAVYEAFFCPDGRRIVTLSRGDGTVRFWLRDTGQLLETHGDIEAWKTSLWTREVGDDVDPEVARWREESAAARGEEKKQQLALREDARRRQDMSRLLPIVWQDGHGRGLTSARFSPDGATLVTWGGDGLVQSWDRYTGANVGTLGFHGSQSLNVEFNRDGSRVLVMSPGTASATLWDARVLEFIASIGGNDEFIKAAALTPDGKRVVSGDLNGHIRFWDASDGRPLEQPHIETVGVQSLAFSADGKVLLGECVDGRARVWRVADGALRATLGARNERIIATFTTDRNRIVTCQAQPGSVGLGYKLAVWRVRDGVSKVFERLTAVYPLHLVASRRLPFEVRADGRRVVTMRRTGDGTPLLWNVDTGELVATLDCGGPGHACGVVYEPNGDCIATFSVPVFAMMGTGEITSTLRLWDGVTHTLRGPPKKVRAPPLRPVLRFSATDNLFCHLSGNYGSTLTMHSVSDASSVGAIHLSTTISDVVVASMAVAAGNKDSGLFTGTRCLASLRSHAEASTLLAIGPDHRRVLSGGRAAQQSCRIWDLSTARQLEQLPVNERLLHAHGVRSVGAAWKFDAKVSGTKLAPDTARWLGHSELFTRSSDGQSILIQNGSQLQILDVSDTPCLIADQATQLPYSGGGPSPETPLPDIVPFSTRAVFSCDGQRIALPAASESDAGTIEIRDRATASAEVDLEGHTKSISRLVFSPDGNWLLSCSFDATARLWSTRTWEETRSYSHNGPVTSATFSDDGAKLVTCGFDHVAKIWDVAGAVEGRVLVGHGGPVTSAAFSADAALVATTSDDGSMRVWDVADGTLRQTLIGHTSAVTKAVFVPGTTRLLSIGADATTRLWDYSTGALLISRVNYDDGNWLAFDASGYYTGTQQAAEWARIFIRGRTWPLSSYSKVFESAEKVAQSIAGRPAAAPTVLPRAPVIEIDSPSAAVLNEHVFELEVTATDDYGVEEILVLQDGRAIAPQVVEAGLKKRRNGRKLTLTSELHFPESVRETTVVVRARNTEGILSWPRSVTVRWEPREKNLYVLALGVADYAESELDLQFPVKDVDDIVAIFEQQTKQNGGLYDHVFVRTRKNDLVTAGNLNRDRSKFLAQAGPDDTVVVFVAGHGLRTAENEYYFLTSDASPDDPYEGITRDALEKLVTWSRLQARRRILFIDTCHSGGSVAVRGLDLALFDQDRVNAVASQSREGIYILAASADDEFAREQMGNGLFTRAILDGLRGDADVDENGFIEIEELKGFVSREVRARSEGAQRPTFPKVVGGEDFRLSKVINP